MKLRIKNYKKVSNRYTDIVVVSEDNSYKHIFPDTSSLALALSKMKNVEFENFSINPFQLKAVQTKETTNVLNQQDLALIRAMVEELLSRPEVDTTALIPVDNTDRLNHIEAELAEIKQKLDIQYNMSKKMNDFIQDNVLVIKDYLQKKLEPMYMTVVDNLYKELKEKDRTKYGKCESDKNTWRYDALPKEALNFVGSLKDDGTNISVEYDELINDENSCKTAFAGINLPTSALRLSYCPTDIVKMRDLVKIMAETRVVTENALKADGNVTKTANLEKSSDLELNMLLSCYNSMILTGLKGFSNLAGDTIGKCSLCYTLVVGVFKVMRTSITTEAANFGKNGSTINSFGDNLAFGSRLQDSTFSVESTMLGKITPEIISNNLKNYILESCRVMTINKRKSFIKGTNAERHPSRIKKLKDNPDFDIKKSPCYKFVKNTAVTCVAADIRLYMTFLKYCQQPYFGFVVKKENLGTKDRIGNNEQQIREFLFNRLQNAYFAAKIMLIDCKDSNMLPIEDRLDWLDSYDVVGVMYGYDKTNFTECQKYLHIEKFLEYLKLGICMQDISPLCADKLVQLFCNYGKINWQVDKDTEKSICLGC